MTLSEFESLPEELSHYPYQIDDDLFLGPDKINDVGIAECLNHSFMPNAGFKGTVHLIAITDIKAGTEITIDYATCFSLDRPAFHFQCCCGSSSCRKKITGRDWELVEVQRRLSSYFQPYLQKHIF